MYEDTETRTIEVSNEAQLISDIGGGVSATAPDVVKTVLGPGVIA